MIVVFYDKKNDIEVKHTDLLKNGLHESMMISSEDVNAADMVFTEKRADILNISGTKLWTTANDLVFLRFDAKKVKK